MKPKKSAPGEMSAATSRPARTPEAQENYMINLAMKLVEKRLLKVRHPALRRPIF